MHKFNFHLFYLSTISKLFDQSKEQHERLRDARQSLRFYGADPKNGSTQPKSQRAKELQKLKLNS